MSFQTKHRTQKYVSILLLINTLALSNTFALSFLPMVKSFDKTEYGAGRQNWDVDIDSHGIVYFGNNSGLLRNIFGIWELSTTSTNDVVRSININNDTIWSGGNREFGYFVKNNSEDLHYEHLGNLQSGLVWHIQNVGNKVYFQTEGHIIQYNKTTKNVDRITHESGFFCIAEWDNKLWFTTRNGGIGYIDSNDKLQIIVQSVNFTGTEVREMYVDAKGLILVLLDGRILSFDGKNIKQELLPKSIAGKAFFSACKYDDQSYLLGTISDGLVHVDNTRNEVLMTVDSDNDLIDNTVLSIARDQNGNVWVGLDYGVAYIELQNTIKSIFDQGATYGIQDHGSATFLATNKGLFFADYNEPFALFPESEGQVWQLRLIDETLYVCHNKGLLKVEEGQLISIYNDDGVMDVAHFPGTKLYLISAYADLQLASYDGHKFQILKHFNLWDNLKIVYDPTNTCIWASKSNQPLRKITLDANSEIEIKEYPRISAFFNFNDEFVFYNDTALYNYNNDDFTPVSTAPLNTIKGSGISSLYRSNDRGTIAFIRNGEPNMLIDLHDGTFHSYEKLLSSVKNNLVSGHEFIDMYKGALRIATDRGVILFDPKSKTERFNFAFPVVSKIVVTEDDGYKLALTYPYIDEVLKFPTGDKNILFNFGIHKASSDFVEFRYQLWPYDNGWSEWTSAEQVKAYTKLKGGSYEFKLECRINGTITKTQSISFSIDQFWYQTDWVLLLYLLFVALCIYLTVRVMNKITAIKLKREQRAHEQNVAKNNVAIKNEQLLQYAEIIGKKNEFLIEVKDGLSRMRNTDARHWENRISEEVSSEKKNFFFHKLFSELHQDFIIRLTEKHPNLTAHDVRIISFIRINLGTREIANLMNISTKSVDINRYRIRKKLELPHETDLNFYIREL